MQFIKFFMTTKHNSEAGKLIAGVIVVLALAGCASSTRITTAPNEQLMQQGDTTAQAKQPFGVSTQQIDPPIAQSETQQTDAAEATVQPTVKAKTTTKTVETKQQATEPVKTVTQQKTEPAKIQSAQPVATPATVRHTPVESTLTEAQIQENLKQAQIESDARLSQIKDEMIKARNKRIQETGDSGSYLTDSSGNSTYIPSGGIPTNADIGGL